MPRSIGGYQLLRAIGAGGVGEVYLASDPELQREVAIKVLRSEVAMDTEASTRLEREARLLASLNHPNIASIYGIERTQASRALVLELVSGPTLHQILLDGPLPVSEAIGMAKQIVSGVLAEPGNIKISDEGLVKILDFGLGWMPRTSG
ncbi:MAG: serine/threonine-protein kinase [Acidobacteriota bacterium]